MKKYFIKFFTIILLSGFSISAYSQERYILNMNDTVIQGRNQVVGLKQLLLQTYPRINLRNTSLNRVRVVGKSRAGRGQVDLFVGGRFQDRAILSGNVRDFNLDLPRTFDRVDLKNNSQRDFGAWQLKFTGVNKVRRIVAFIDDNDRNILDSYELETLGIQDAGRFFIDQDHFSGGGSIAHAIILRGISGYTDVERVFVTFENGVIQSIPELQGALMQGEVSIYDLRFSRRISKIEMWVVSPNLFGPKGEYEVLLGTRSLRPF